MKRSELNQLLLDAVGFCKQYRFALPPFATWSPEDWASKGKEYQEICDNMLGWDITDFGSGDFYKTGLLLFTIRNGNQTDTTRYPKPYAEKLLIVRENQVTPYHFHFNKMEDIINRGGGRLMVKVYNATPDEQLDTVNPVLISMDGRNFEAPAGTVVELSPGESITLPRRQYHSFWAADADCLVGEVSCVNDDTADNRFLEPASRFPAVEEDEAPVYLLAMDLSFSQ